MRAVEDTLVVGTRPPAEWDSWVGPDAPTLRSNWIELASHRLANGLVTFAAHNVDGLALAIGGTVLARAGTNPRLDPYLMLTGESRADGLLPEGPHPWRSRPENETFPCLHLMLPNYETTVIGPRRDDPPSLDRFVAGIEGWAREHGCRSIAISYLLPEPVALRPVLRQRAWFVGTMTHRCDLSVGWDDFDGYLSTFRSKRRVAIRRELRDLRQHGVTLDSAPIRLAELDELVRLRLCLLRKYRQPADAEREYAVLDRLRAHFDPKDLTVFAARLGDRLLGYTLMVRDGPGWTALMTGTDYAERFSSYCYFATCYYEPARLAPRLGIRSISYGMGSWAAKRLRGCELVPLSIAATTLSERP